VTRRQHSILLREPVRDALLVAFITIGAVVALLIAYRVLDVLKIVALAVLLALVLRTAARGLDRLGLSPFLASIILLAGVGAVGALLYFVVLPEVAREVKRLVSSSGTGSLSALEGYLGGVPFSTELSDLLQRLQGQLTGFIAAVPRVLSSAASAVGGLLAVVFLALYFAVSPETYIRGLLRIVPPERRDGVERFIGILARRLRGWITGTGMVAGFVGVSAGVGLWLLGVPSPLTFGLLAGLLNIIPLFGSILGGAPPALLALTISPFKALQVVALFVILNQIDGNVLQPQIIGRQVHLPPALILVSILLLGTLLGPIVGTLLAIPAAVLVVTLAEHLVPDPSSSNDVAEDAKAGGDSLRESQHR
jgi:predicted PurR-regulated permease PerM